jgi:hypothetical protein
VGRSKELWSRSALRLRAEGLDAGVRVPEWSRPHSLVLNDGSAVCHAPGGEGHTWRSAIRRDRQLWEVGFIRCPATLVSPWRALATTCMPRWRCLGLIQMELGRHAARSRSLCFDHGE